jgi:hypothetical protein
MSYKVIYGEIDEKGQLYITRESRRFNKNKDRLVLMECRRGGIYLNRDCLPRHSPCSHDCPHFYIEGTAYDSNNNMVNTIVHLCEGIELFFDKFIDKRYE